MVDLKAAVEVILSAVVVMAAVAAVVVAVVAGEAILKIISTSVRWLSVFAFVLLVYTLQSNT